SLCSMLKLIVSLRAALNSRTGIVTSPNVRWPFHTLAAICPPVVQRDFRIRQSRIGCKRNVHKALMPLEEYARKRRFENTPEPPPSKQESKKAANYFCVQRHDATRLHYDFRLEIDGVLKSWAVPKGPTLDPGAKHFAAHVEDHPVDYGDFEGTIPAGNYGAGSVLLWDRGSFELLGGVPAKDQLGRGDLKFRLHGEKLKGDFALVRMKVRGKGNEWLIIKKRDEFADPGWDVEGHAYSVLSGRTQEEIAQNL